eukprot:TRINITY_DN3489_c0_g1_i2.p1 TRINITY_DN3489_c0_g1~~TRINITY_DN3489_c0_g1_i2.p1  ORF type:complete len:356 (-),score=64.49 TRINITY_DN3489_c0_g1_i2:454-1521(-)
MDEQQVDQTAAAESINILRGSLNINKPKFYPKSGGPLSQKNGGGMHMNPLMPLTSTQGTKESLDTIETRPRTVESQKPTGSKSPLPNNDLNNVSPTNIRAIFNKQNMIGSAGVLKDKKVRTTKTNENHNNGQVNKQLVETTPTIETRREIWKDILPPALLERRMKKVDKILQGLVLANTEIKKTVESYYEQYQKYKERQVEKKIQEFELPLASISPDRRFPAQRTSSFNYKSPAIGLKRIIEPSHRSDQSPLDTCDSNTLDQKGRMDTSNANELSRDSAGLRMSNSTLRERKSKNLLGKSEIKAALFKDPFTVGSGDDTPLLKSQNQFRISNSNPINYARTIKGSDKPDSSGKER